MRIENVEFNVYKFEELKSEIQDKVIEKSFIENESEHNNDYFKESAMELLGLLGFENAKLGYSLSYSQGDGLSYEFELYAKDIIDILNMGKHKIAKEKGYKLLEKIVDEIYEVAGDFEIKEDLIKDEDTTIRGNRSMGNRYYYSNSVDLDVEYSSMYVDLEVEYIEELLEVLKEIYFVICDELEDYGYDTIYYKMTREEYAEHSEANGYKYLEGGELFTY